MANNANELLTKDRADDEDDEDTPSDDTGAAADQPDIDGDAAAAPASRRSPHRIALAAGAGIVVVLASLTTWLGLQAYQSHQASNQRATELSVARQGAINLTTIDWRHVEDDVKRILDSATGQFHDDFAQRSQPFVDTVKQAQSASVGTVTEAGVESEDADGAQVLVAVSVKTSTAAATEQEPRSWRMRISVHRDGGEVKVSNVEFVP